MANVADFLGRIAAGALEGPEQVLGLLGEGIQLFGEQLEKMAELLDQFEQKLTSDSK